MDALVNHLDKIKDISKGEFNPKVVIRCVVGNVTKPLYTGATHTQDFSNALRTMVNIPVYQLLNTKMIDRAYELVDGYEESAILIEYKDLI
jgi:pyruvate/2-oxoglutarate/acetoin dehydrogenase E1 component